MSSPGWCSCLPKSRYITGIEICGGSSKIKLLLCCNDKLVGFSMFCISRMANSRQPAPQTPLNSPNHFLWISGCYGMLLHVQFRQEGKIFSLSGWECRWIWVKSQVSSKWIIRLVTGTGGSKLRVTRLWLGLYAIFQIAICQANQQYFKHENPQPITLALAAAVGWFLSFCVCVCGRSMKRGNARDCQQVYCWHQEPGIYQFHSFSSLAVKHAMFLFHPVFFTFRRCTYIKESTSWEFSPLTAQRMALATLRHNTPSGL